MARADGLDLDRRKRLQLVSIQPDLRREYPHKLPPGTLLMRCGKCQAVLPLSCFSRNTQRRYGVKATCRGCLKQTRPASNNEPDPSLTRKWCYLCKAHHPIEAFHIDRSQPDGYARWCREAAYRRRERRVDAQHYDTVREYRHSQTIRLCGELGLDYPGHDIKRCNACGKVKHVNEFVNDWRKKDRKKIICRDCYFG